MFINKSIQDKERFKNEMKTFQHPENTYQGQQPAQTKQHGGKAGTGGSVKIKDELNNQYMNRQLMNQSQPQQHLSDCCLLNHADYFNLDAYHMKILERSLIASNELRFLRTRQAQLRMEVKNSSNFISLLKQDLDRRQAYMSELGQSQNGMRNQLNMYKSLIQKLGVLNLNITPSTTATATISSPTNNSHSRPTTSTLPSSASSSSSSSTNTSQNMIYLVEHQNQQQQQQQQVYKAAPATNTIVFQSYQQQPQQQQVVTQQTGPQVIQYNQYPYQYHQQQFGDQSQQQQVYMSDPYGQMMHQQQSQPSSVMYSNQQPQQVFAQQPTTMLVDNNNNTIKLMTTSSS